MKIARFLVSPELLRQCLHLPVTAEIVWAEMDARDIALTVTDPALRDVTLIEEERPPLISPVLHEIVIDGVSDDECPLELQLQKSRHRMVVIDWYRT